MRRTLAVIVATPLLGALAIGVAVALMVLLSRPFQTGPEGPSLLLITVDTLRADRLGAYGWRVGTPAIDALARRGTLFEDAFTVSPVTLPAHATMLTGHLPARHGIRGNSFYTLRDAEVTLAEILKANGYRTTAVVGAAVLDRRFGLHRGFEVYDDEMPGNREGLIADRGATAVVSQALQRLDTESGAPPFFLWVHLFDPHHPYAPPEPLRATFDGHPYDGEIAHVDGEIGRLLSSLERRGALDDTLVVLTSDHGESLGEHGEATHGVFLYDSTLRVPLIFAGPGVPEGVRRGGDPVSLADLLPTVLAKLNVPTPQNLDGHDLFAAAASGRDFVYAETYLPRDFYNWSELHALRSSETKFIHSPVQERYDLKQDPLETRNNAVQDDERVRQLTRIVTKLAHDAGTTGRAVPDPALAARLQSLGYVATGGPAMSADDRADVRPDVKTRIHLVGRIDEALALKRVARNDAAATLLRQILSEDPANYLAAHTLGDVLFDLTRNEEALAAYRLAMRGREAAYYHYRIALLHERMGDYRAAAREFGLVARLTPEAAKEILERANTLRARGFARDGRAYLEALASPLGPTSESPTAAATPEVLNALGVARGEAGDLTGAVEAFAQAARTAPADFDSHANLALTRARQGDADAALASLARALELKPNETRLINLAAELRFRRNELETARALLSRSLAIDPEQPRIVQALRDVERQLSGR